MPPWPLLLWQHWPLAILLAGGWLLLWLWRGFISPRPRRAPAEPPRRGVLEQVAGTARFLYQQQRPQDLLTPLRETVTGGRVVDAKLVRRLAERSKEAPVRVEWALTAEPGADGGDFSRMVRILRRLADADREHV